MIPSWTVTIKPVANGVIAQVGCQTLVFAKKDYPEFLVDLSDYLKGDQKALAEKYGIKAGMEEPRMEEPRIAEIRDTCDSAELCQPNTSFNY